MNVLVHVNVNVNVPELATFCPGALYLAVCLIRFFSIARESVMEYGALFDLSRALNQISAAEYGSGKILLTRINVTLERISFRG